MKTINKRLNITALNEAMNITAFKDEPSVESICAVTLKAIKLKGISPIDLSIYLVLLRRSEIPPEELVRRSLSSYLPSETSKFDTLVLPVGDELDTWQIKDPREIEELVVSIVGPERFKSQTGWSITVDFILEYIN
jgi:hypothetical protein